MEVELSKLKDKQAREFDNMLDFSKDNMPTWTMDYFNLNNKIFITIGEACDDLIEVEKEIFEINIKQEVTVSPLEELISNWLDKQLALVTKTV